MKPNILDKGIIVESPTELGVIVRGLGFITDIVGNPENEVVQSANQLKERLTDMQSVFDRLIGSGDPYAVARAVEARSPELTINEESETSETLNLAEAPAPSRLIDCLGYALFWSSYVDDDPVSQHTASVMLVSYQEARLKIGLELMRFVQSDPGTPEA